MELSPFLPLGLDESGQAFMAHGLVSLPWGAKTRLLNNVLCHNVFTAATFRVGNGAASH